ncbi:MAG: T9SS type A sorting domain-containing protein, partial [Candidatus Zixiibacteriota bacterium]
DDELLATIHFSIGKIDLIQPNGGEVWYGGDEKLIEWSSHCDWNVNDTVVIDSFRRTDNYPIPPVNFSDPQGGQPSVEFKYGELVQATQTSDSVMIEYSADAGKIWSTVVASTPNDGEYLWSPVPNPPSDSCLIRVSSKVANPISVLSDGFFTILSETTGVREEKKPENLPEKFVLYQNYPNPFNPSTKIEFSMSEGAQVRLGIYDITGRRVKKLLDEALPSGHWSIVWNGEDDKGMEVASGVYFYRLKTYQYTQTRKMVIVR